VSEAAFVVPFARKRNIASPPTTSMPKDSTSTTRATPSRARARASFYGRAMAKITDFRIDEATWQSASDARKLDWTILLRELVEHGDFAETLAQRHVLVTPREEHVTITALDDDGVVVQEEPLAWEPLKATIAEYIAIIAQLDSSGGHRGNEWFATLDMAKKVVHDRAAAALLQSGIAASTEKATLRRLFSLLFALRVDTSRMQYASGHRDRE
jgi:hypothetical protein